MIQEKIQQGMYIKDIAEELGVHPRTVRRALKRGSAPPGKRPAARRSKLDPFKPLIDRLLSEGVWNSVVIQREIEAAGYTGRGAILRAYIQPKRVLRPSRATVRFETGPGEQLQHDWAEIGTTIAGVARKVHFAVNTLGFSRRFHVWATDSQDAEHTYEALIRSFEYFGGVPADVLVDNQKSAVIEHRIGDAVRFNARFLDLAGHYGFRPRACRPYRARYPGQGRTHGALRQAPLLRALPILRESHARKPASGAVAPGGSRCAGARHPWRGGDRTLPEGTAAAPGLAGPPFRHQLPRGSACRLRRLYRCPRQPLQRAGRGDR